MSKSPMLLPLLAGWALMRPGRALRVGASSMAAAPLAEAPEALPWPEILTRLGCDTSGWHKPRRQFTSIDDTSPSLSRHTSSWQWPLRQRRSIAGKGQHP
mgnify:CR=1 FL=1